MSKIIIQLTGLIPSKKNNQRILKRRDGRRFIAPGAAHQKWHKQAMAAIIPEKMELQRRHKLPITKTKRLEITVFFSTRARADQINKAETILDFLQDCGIISDDSWQVLPEYTLKGIYKAKQPGAAIKITY